MTDNKKTLICPTCQSTDIARVMMGMPAFTKQLEQDIEDGKISLGGCLTSDGGDPHLVCNTCKHQWRWDGKKVKYPVDTSTDWLHGADDAPQDTL